VVQKLSGKGDREGIDEDSRRDRGMSDAVMLSDVAMLVMGQSPPSTSYNDAGDGLPFYQGKTDFGATYPTPRIYCSEPKKLAEEGDILMSVRAPVGATNLCNTKSCIGRGIAAIRANGIDRDFLYFYLKKIEGYIDSLGSGAIFKAINKSQLAELPINDAGISLPEQKKIAHILSTVQRAIEAQERIIATTTELKKALMQKLFTEGLRNEPKKQTEIGPVPKSWEVVPLEQIAESFQYGTSVKCGYDVKGKPVLRIPNVVGGAVDINDLKFGKPKPNEIGNLRLQSGDLLFVRTNGVKENAGRCSLFEDEIEDCYFASYLIRVRLDPRRLNPSFLNEYSRTEVGTSFLSGKSIRTADGKFNINSGTLKTMLVPVPAIYEQEEIARALASIDSKSPITRAKLSALQDLFRTLLHELMTAKTRVHELELPTKG